MKRDRDTGARIPHRVTPVKNMIYRYERKRLTSLTGFAVFSCGRWAQTSGVYVVALVAACVPHLRPTDLLTQNAFKRMVPHRYDVMKYIVFPATAEKQCSYVELVAPEGTTAQTPAWFVSHWYGRRVLSDMESGISMSSCELETCFLFSASTSFDDVY